MKKLYASIKQNWGWIIGAVFLLAGWSLKRPYDMAIGAYFLVMEVLVGSLEAILRAIREPRLHGNVDYTSTSKTVSVRYAGDATEAVAKLNYIAAQVREVQR